MIEFERGPYDEILLPPLIGDVSPEEAWKRLYAFSLSKGNKLNKPEAEEDRAILYKLGGIFVHQTRLREVIAGQSETEVEITLRDEVWRGERLSLRPLGLEDKEFQTFAPVLERLGMTEWLVGLRPARGR
jgi:hypothetical protein